MSDLGLLSYYLGIEVHQKLGEITLCQEAYAKKILEKCGIEEYNPTHVLMELRLKLGKRSEAPIVDATEYRSVVGSLRYLINKRLDLAYSVGYVSRFMEAPTNGALDSREAYTQVYQRDNKLWYCLLEREGGGEATWLHR